MDSAILARYRQESVKTIPMFEMNMPVMDRTVFGDVGLELEMEGRNLPTAAEVQRPGVRSGAYWTTHQDGSLRGESTEYVLSTPCYEEEVQALVQALWAAFEAKHTELHNSNRCSTHCHINIQGLKISDLIGVIALWSVFEKQIIEKFGGEGRTHNHFCLSLRDTDENVNRMATFLKTGGAPSGRDLRYAALNIASIWMRGSVEFRCAPAADTPDIPIEFGLFLKKFVEFAAKEFHDPTVIGAVLSERGAVDLFQAVCDSNPNLNGFYRKVVPQGEEYHFNRDGLEGFRITQPLCHMFPWYEWMPLIDKKVIDPFGAASAAKTKARPRRQPDYIMQAERMMHYADEGPARGRGMGIGELNIREAGRRQAAAQLQEMNRINNWLDRPVVEAAPIHEEAAPEDVDDFDQMLNVELNQAGD